MPKKNKNGGAKPKPNAAKQGSRAMARGPKKGTSNGQKRGSPAHPVGIPPLRQAAPMRQTVTNKGLMVSWTHQMTSEKYNYSTPAWVSATADAGAVTSDGNGKAAVKFRIAPTILSTRNATFLTMYELAHISNVRLRWIPNASVATPGSVIAAVDYNAGVGGFPTTLVGAAQREGSLRKKVYEEFIIPVKWRDAIDTTAYVSSSSATSHRPDGQAYEIGFVVDGAPNNTLLGYVEIQATYHYSGLKATSE